MVTKRRCVRQGPNAAGPGKAADGTKGARQIIVNTPVPRTVARVVRTVCKLNVVVLHSSICGGAAVTGSIVRPGDGAATLRREGKVNIRKIYIVSEHEYAQDKRFGTDTHNRPGGAFRMRS